MRAGYWAFPVGELRPAVISRISLKREITMKTLIIAALRCSLMFLVTASPFFGRPAQAYTVTLEQVGANVVAPGNGPINLTGLTFNFIATTTPGVAAVEFLVLSGYWRCHT